MNYARMFTRRSDGRYMASYTQEGKRRWLYDRDPEKLYQRLQDARKGGSRTFAQVVEEWREEHSRTVGFNGGELCRAMPTDLRCLRRRPAGGGNAGQAPGLPG